VSALGSAGVATRHEFPPSPTPVPLTTPQTFSAVADRYRGRIAVNRPSLTDVMADSPTPHPRHLQDRSFKRHKTPAAFIGTGQVRKVCYYKLHEQRRATARLTLRGRRSPLAQDQNGNVIANSHHKASPPQPRPVKTKFTMISVSQGYSMAADLLADRELAAPVRPASQTATSANPLTPCSCGIGWLELQTFLARAMCGRIAEATLSGIRIR